MESSNRSRFTFGAAALLLGAAAFGPHFCSKKADSSQVDDAADTTIVISPKHPRALPENEDVRSEDSSIQEVQNAQSEEVMLCVQSNASRKNLDVDCDEKITEMQLPGSEEVMSIKQIECTSYDQDGHPESKAFTYIGPSCEPDGIEDNICNQPEEISFVSVTSEVPLGSYVDLNLPNLESAWGSNPLTTENSAITAFSDTQEGLSSETGSLCASTLELLTHQESPQNIQANDFSRELMNVSDFLVANGIDHELPEDSRLFTPFPNVEVRFKNASGIPMSCAVDFEEEQLRCSPAYAGFIHEEHGYVMGEGWNQGLEDPNCAFNAPLDDLWKYNQKAAGVRDCSSGYIFTADPL